MIEVGTGPCVNTSFDEDPWAPAYVAGRALGRWWIREQDPARVEALRRVGSAAELARYLENTGPQAGFLVGDLLALVDEARWEGVKARLLVVAKHTLHSL